MREGRPPLLIDLRPVPGPLTLRGALPCPGPWWTPPSDQDVVLFDEDGTLAVEAARRLQAAGYSRVRALFGGLELWDFSLDPEVVGDDTGLERL
jgi:rhodanese-related sulfurtransferase